MARLFFTSDIHFSHRKLAIEIRGFSSIEEHDEVLIENWNKTVKPEDTVINLGDVTLKKPNAVASLVGRLNGTQHLITGNHDYCFPGMRESYRWQKEYFKIGFDSVQAYARRRIDGINILLSHFPYTGDHGPDRHTQYRLRNEGLPLLHGHTHSDSKFSISMVSVPQIHIGLDAWNLRPVAIEEVMDLLKG